MTRRSDQYVVGDCWINQILMIDGRGKVKKSYRGKIHGVDLGKLRGIITDLHGGVLIADYCYNQVLLLRRTGDVGKILDQHVIEPWNLYLNTDHHRLYVSGKDQHNVHHVFVFIYTLPSNDKKSR